MSARLAISLGILIGLNFLIANGCFASEVDADILQVGTLSANSSSVNVSTSLWISNTSLTLTGQGGYITASSSISASAFFGDGNNLTGIVRLASTQTLSAAYLFTSSFTVQSGGRQISLSTGNSVANFQIRQDGAITFFPELHNSSSTIIPQFSTTVSTYGICVPGSSVTVTTAGGQLELSFSGTIVNVLGNGFAGVGFLVDGGYVGNLNSINGFRRGFFSGGSQRSVNINYLSGPLSAGIHTACLTFCSPSATRRHPSKLGRI